MRGLAALVLAVAMLTGCRGWSGAPVSVTPGHEDRSTGSVVHSWAEGDSAQAEGVRAIRDDYRTPRLITDAGAWHRFVHGLPQDLRDADAQHDLAGVSPESAVIVVTTYDSCTSVGRLESRGSGGLDFVVEDTGVGCMWSPTVLQVWRVTPAEVGAIDKGDVHLVD